MLRKLTVKLDHHRTLDELANTAYLFLDGRLKQTIWGEDGYNWRWYELANISLEPGSHQILIRKQGNPVAVDKVAISSDDDFRHEQRFKTGPRVEPLIDPFFENIGYKDDKGAFRITARLPTGFGVPGSGFPRFLNEDTLILPGGEGAVTAVDVSNPHNPQIKGYYLNWYFNNAVFPDGKGFYLNSRHRGVYYVDGTPGKKSPARFRKIEMDYEKYGRLGAVFPQNGSSSLAITKGGSDGAAIMDMSHPIYPAVIGKVKGYQEKGFLLSQARKSGASINRAGILGIIDFENPEKAYYKAIFKVPSEVIKGVAKRSEIIGLSKNYLFIKQGLKIHVFKRNGVFKISPLGIIKLKKGAGPFVRSYEQGGFIHVIDGVRGPGQYSMHSRSRHSKWHVYNPDILKEPVYTYEDPSPTAYSYTTFKNDKAYVFDYNYGLWIFDLDDPERPQKIGGIATAGEGHYLHVLDNDVLCLSQTFGGTITTIDVTNPQEPKKIGQFWDGSWFTYDTASHTDLMAGKGTVLYFPKPGQGIQIIDFKTPEKPKVLGFIKGGKCRVVGTRLYTISGRELLIYDVSSERMPNLIGKLETGIRNTSMAIDHPEKIWLTDLTRIIAVNISNPRKPEIIGKWENKGKKKFWGGIVYNKGYLYGSFGEKSRSHEIATIDIRNPAQMEMVDLRNWQAKGLHSVTNDSWANFYRGDFFIKENYLFASNYGRVEVYDVLNPLIPKPVQMLNTGFQWSCGKIKKGFLFVPTLNGLVVVKLTKS